MKKVVIIGGGIVGLATAYKLSIRNKNLSIVVLEKENDVGKHQSTHNSGVLHCGLYYVPGSLKAKLAVNGIRQMTAFCKEYNIPHKICGKLVVATNDIEIPRLNQLYDRGIKNGLIGVSSVTNKEIKDIEPYVNGKAGLFVPEEGIVDYSVVINTLKKLILRNRKCKIHTSQKVIAIENNEVITTLDAHEYDYLISCAGLYSDKVANLTDSISTKIVPFRGEYYKLKPHADHLVRNLVYPVPDPAFPFLGVHFTRTIHGYTEAGPNAVLAFSREGYSIKDVNLHDIYDYTKFKGFWKFIWNHKKMCLHEFYQSISKRKFCKSLQKLVPSLKNSDIEFGGSGVRAQAMSLDGHLIHDFELRIKNNICHVINAPSPAATASLAIADTIIDSIQISC